MAIEPAQRVYEVPLIKNDKLEGPIKKKGDQQKKKKKHDKKGTHKVDIKV